MHPTDHISHNLVFTGNTMQMFPYFLAMIISISIWHHLEIIIVAILCRIIQIQFIMTGSDIKQHQVLFNLLRHFVIFQFINYTAFIFTFIGGLELFTLFFDMHFEYSVDIERRSRSCRLVGTRSTLHKMVVFDDPFMILVEIVVFGIKQLLDLLLLLDNKIIVLFVDLGSNDLNVQVYDEQQKPHYY